MNKKAKKIPGQVQVYKIGRTKRILIYILFLVKSF